MKDKKIEEAAKLYEEGLVFYESKSLRRAYCHFKEALELDPNDKQIKRYFQRVKEDLGMEETNSSDFQLVRNENFALTSSVKSSSDFVTRAEFAGVMYKVANKFADNDQAIEAINQALGEVIRTVDNQQEILDIIGGTREAAVIKAITRLKNENLELYKYCQTFHYTIVNLFEAYKILGTNIVAAELNKFEGMQCKAVKIWACYLANGAEMATTFFLPALGPFICSAHEFSATVYEYTIGRKVENRTECINKIRAEKFEFTNKMYIELGELALAITDTNRDRILNPLIKDKKQLAPLSYLKQKIFGVLSSNKEEAPVKLAAEDVSLFLTYLFKNHESILENKKVFFCKQIQTILKSSTNLLTDTYKEALESFEPIKLIENIIPKSDLLEIEVQTLRGKWATEKGYFSTTLGVSDYFKEDYIKKICKNNILSWKGDLARLAILNKMFEVLANSQNLECLIEVNKHYPHIIKDMLVLFPKHEIAKKFIENNQLLLSDQSFNAQQLQLENGNDSSSDDSSEGFYVVPLAG
ncbi:hypothetical protein [Rickettsia endosymbiont of Halotydeus destructor]|uniref:hypothetical protein n=1 Tax=Rickettsia endosymbiont of Halotydeus destructor TaxID=2996754 RepID=UPI003BB1E2FB